MKLSKIYSNKKNFKPILFNDGFSVIFGDVEDINKGDKKASEHNLGKTSLLYLIDFLLLKGVKEDGFFGKHKDKFLDWVFFLEIKLNDGKYLTIRRSIEENTKVSFKEHFSKDQNFVEELNWDHENLSIFTKKQDKNAKYILEKEYLRFDVNTNFDYRSFLPYLLRNQNDYQDVFRLNKFRGSDASWKPALFDVLGFNPELIERKYEMDTEIEDETRYIAKLQGKNDDEEIYKTKAIIEAKRIEKEEIQKNLDSFNFYKDDQNINFDLVKNIEDKIVKLNKREYAVTHNIEQIRKSLDNSSVPSVEVKDLKKIFEEAKIFFPDNLAKNYEDVLSFSSQITKEREIYLKDELKDLEKKQEVISLELKNLNEHRAELLSLLQEKDTFLKYKKLQEGLIKIESEILVFQQKLDQAKTVENYQKNLDKTQVKLKELTTSLKEEINQDNQDFTEIKRIFQDIYKKTFDFTALLIVAINTYGNIKFDTDVLGLEESSTGKGDGYTSTKILCASFVLAILIHYSNRSFFRFAYHDGVLESWGDNHKVQFLELMREYCGKYNIQYTISLIKSDIPKGFSFSDTEIVRTLSNSDRLFDFEF